MKFGKHGRGHGGNQRKHCGKWREWGGGSQEKQMESGRMLWFRRPGIHLTIGGGLCGMWHTSSLPLNPFQQRLGLQTGVVLWGSSCMQCSETASWCRDFGQRKEVVLWGTSRAQDVFIQYAMALQIRLSCSSCCVSLMIINCPSAK